MASCEIFDCSWQKVLQKSHKTAGHGLTLMWWQGFNLVDIGWKLLRFFALAHSSATLETSGPNKKLDILSPDLVLWLLILCEIFDQRVYWFHLTYIGYLQIIQVWSVKLIVSRSSGGKCQKQSRETTVCFNYQSIYGGSVWCSGWKNVSNGNSQLWWYVGLKNKTNKQKTTTTTTTKTKQQKLGGVGGWEEDADVNSLHFLIDCKSLVIYLSDKCLNNKSLNDTQFFWFCLLNGQKY